MFQTEFTLFFGKVSHMEVKKDLVWLLQLKLLSYLEELPCGINDPILSMRVSLTRGQYASFVSVYAPTLYTLEKTRIAFH